MSKHSVDIQVGQRIRRRRWLTGLTQQHLAQKVGVRFQQIQKYEKGINRVSASRLWDISVVLGVPISYFFDELPEHDDKKCDLIPSQLPIDPLTDREALDLLRSFYTMPKKQRQKLFDLAQALGEAA